MNKYGSARIERKKFWDRMRIYGYVAGALLLVILIGYVFVGSPIFKISTITINSPSNIDSEAIIKIVKEQVRNHAGLLGPDSYFSWDENATYTAPNVSLIAVEKKIFSKTITLKVSPRERFIVWCAGADTSDASPDASVGVSCFWADQSGLLFEPAPVTEGQLVLSVYDDAPAALLVLGQPVLEADQFEAVSKIFRSDILKEIGIRSIKLSRSLEQLEAMTNGGTKLLFSVRFDPTLTALPALIKFQTNPGLSKLEYINLTVENRAFVKYR